MQINLKLTQPQADFIGLDCKFPAFVAGFGTGKSEVMCTSALLDSLEGGSSSLIAMYEPTYDLVRLILAPRMEEKLSDWGVRYKYNKSENIIYTSNGQMGDFVLRTLDNPARIVGYESFRAKIDELDTLKQDHAQEAWTKIIARNRQNPSTYIRQTDKPINTVSVFTTPEGFRFVHDRWVKNRAVGHEMIQASTMSNPFLPEDYVEALRSSYPPQLIEAYLNGQFVNLTSGSIYTSYDRKVHSSREEVKRGERLIIGMDFNVNNMASRVFVERGKALHCVEEISKGLDTPYMIELIKQRYEGHQVYLYPDASGKNTSSKGAAISDINMLSQAGFIIQAHDANPRVKDRIMSVNNAFSQGRLFVNEIRCPETANELEQQAYDKNGQPDKSSGLDHGNDAFGYPVAFRMPVVRPTIAAPRFG